ASAYAWSFLLQAEDGIRAFHVTGVQTCALPIYPNEKEIVLSEIAKERAEERERREAEARERRGERDRERREVREYQESTSGPTKIGRASCRESVWIAVAVVSWTSKSGARVPPGH